jgi:FMN phosphatase YigB (HAD superfamily)
VGVSKPAAAIFRAGLEAAGAANTEAVMLGDSWLTDIKGARQAGLRAVWLNRFGEVSPDPTVPELRALEPVVDALNLILSRL